MLNLRLLQTMKITYNSSKSLVEGVLLKIAYVFNNYIPIFPRDVGMLSRYINPKVPYYSAIRAKSSC